MYTEPNVTFYAFDGTSFDNDEECERYEKDKLNSGDILFYDKDMNEMKFTYSHYEDIVFLYCKNEAAADNYQTFLKQEYDEDHVILPNALMYCDENTGYEWISIDTYRKQLTDYVDRMEAKFMGND